MKLPVNELCVGVRSRVEEDKMLREKKVIAEGIKKGSAAVHPHRLCPRATGRRRRMKKNTVNKKS